MRVTPLVLLGGIAVVSSTFGRARAQWDDSVYEVNSQGIVQPSPNNVEIEGLGFGTGDSGCDVSDRAVVVSLPDGTRAGCGLIGEDLWNGIQVTADGNGESSQSISVPGYQIESSSGVSLTTSAGDAYNAFGRVVVVHANDGTRIACGGTVSNNAAITMSTYPGYTGNLAVSGTVTVTNDASSNSVTMRTQLSGLEASVTGGLHIHAGTSCATANDVEGHLFDSSIAVIGAYPGFSGNDDIRGLASVANSDNLQNVVFSASLVDVGSTLSNGDSGTVAIHTGNSCSDTMLVGDQMDCDGNSGDTTALGMAALAIATVGIMGVAM